MACIGLITLLCIHHTRQPTISFGISHHQYADETQLYMIINARSVDRLSICADAVTKWYLENGLQLDPNKIKAIATGTQQQLVKFDKTKKYQEYSML